ncbi:MAG: nucleoside deaminase [Alphaproteobacteria bacterium]|nr:nucleoside deaminase [Alphaproteobacteria bacterium]
MNSLSFFMSEALKEAQTAFERNSVPVGAVVVRDDKIIAAAGNEVIKLTDSTAHAEILAIRRAEQYLQSQFLTDCDLFVTLEPCAMCAQAISLARIRTLYFGAYDVKYGAVVHGCHVFRFSPHKPRVISGVLETECAKILTEFFEGLR